MNFYTIDGKKWDSSWGLFPKIWQNSCKLQHFNCSTATYYYYIQQLCFQVLTFNLFVCVHAMFTFYYFKK